MFLVVIIAALTMIVALSVVGTFMSGFTGETVGRFVAKSSSVLFLILVML